MAFKNSLERTELLKASHDNVSEGKSDGGSDSAKTTSRLLLGMLAVFVSNLFTLSSDYSIKLFNLQYGELFFVLGTSATVVYGTILLLKVSI